MRMKLGIIVFGASTLLLACVPATPGPVYTNVPSLDYARRVRTGNAVKQQTEQKTYADRALVGFKSPNPQMQASPQLQGAAAGKARLRFVKDYEVAEPAFAGGTGRGGAGGQGDMVMNLNDAEMSAQGYEVHRSNLPNVRDYNGPLSLGDPGVSASLWHESRGGNDLFRDDRAFQPMDLLTIIVSESAEGTKEADTEVKQESEILAGIKSFFGLDAKIEGSHGDLDTESLIEAGTQNDFKGEGETTRKGSLKAKISVMVVEVLPSGIIRVEGEKIISVNSEEQVMVISGLVRPRDINSGNEVDSSKIANLRIDYFGRGTVGEAQRGGWLGRAIRTVWPF
ncbi:flagellar basal body L-ring protein FlgH [Oligoflexia bacterium]|nr:flagellar basal body L-ring protein FlgH [Oligoflexia bacterium]